MWQFLQAQAVIMLALIHGTVVVIAGALIAGRLRKRQFLGAAGGEAASGARAALA